MERDKELVVQIQNIIPQKDIEEIVRLRHKIEEDISPDEARDQILKCRDDINRNYFIMAGILYKISREKWYLKWSDINGEPYLSLGEYVEKELGFSLRKAQYLIQIWNWYVIQLGDPELIKKVSKIGWAKAAILVGAITSDNADDWIERGLSATAVQLQQEVKELLTKSAMHEEVYRMTFSLYKEQYDMVEQALQIALERGNTKVKSHALSLIALDYVSGHLKRDNLMANLRTYLKRIEKLLNVGFIVVKPESKEIIYKSDSVDLEDKKDE